jgi:hypothetical protein
MKISCATGRVLLTGPSNAGKTRHTAKALAEWIDSQGPTGVSVLDFAPELERNGVLLGGRLSRFTEIPEEAWVGVIDAHAPRAESESEEVARELARENATQAMAMIKAMPSSKAVFINDATIPFQHEAGDIETLLAACKDAELVVVNAFSGTALGSEDSISRREREARKRLTEWADTHERLGDGE